MNNTSLHKKLILVVDDEPMISEHLAFFLKDALMDSKIATSVDDAIKLIKIHQFDCVVSDYMMPQKNGMELIRIIREELKSNCKIILMTGHDDPKLKAQAKKMNANIVLKPYVIEDLISLIKKN